MRAYNLRSKLDAIVLNRDMSALIVKLTLEFSENGFGELDRKM